MSSRGGGGGGPDMLAPGLHFYTPYLANSVSLSVEEQRPFFFS